MRVATLRSSSISLLFMTAISAKSSEIHARQDCENNFSKCSPPGATSTSVAEPGSGLSSLYVDLLDSISGVKSRRNGFSNGDILWARASQTDICCADGTDCLLLQNLNLPFCYDKFTTNFFLPDNSYGTIVTGSYTPSNGGSVNLLMGNYTLANGTSGNLYGSDPASKPNTATLTLPTQYTASGVGSAIPASALGAEITYTTTIPGTTILPTTLPVETVTFTPAVVGSSTPAATVTTEVATTIPGTTVPPTTVTITTPGPVTHAATTSSTGAATAIVRGDSNSVVGLLSFLFAALVVL